jgi:hypothetical protein
MSIDACASHVNAGRDLTRLQQQEQSLTQRTERSQRGKRRNENRSLKSKLNSGAGWWRQEFASRLAPHSRRCRRSRRSRRFPERRRETTFRVWRFPFPVRRLPERSRRFLERVGTEDLKDRYDFRIFANYEIFCSNLLFIPESEIEECFSS